MRGVYLRDDGVDRLLVPPGCVAGLGAEALLLRAGVLLEDYEWLEAEEAEGGGHLLIFFALENPSPFGAAADGLTPSPHLPGPACRRPWRWGRTLACREGANVHLAQCLRAFADRFCVEVNITTIVGMSARNRPKCVVSEWCCVGGVGHFGPLPKPSHGSARR